MTPPFPAEALLEAAITATVQCVVGVAGAWCAMRLLGSAAASARYRVWLALLAAVALFQLSAVGGAVLLAPTAGPAGAAAGDAATALRAGTGVDEVAPAAAGDHGALPPPASPRRSITLPVPISSGRAGQLAALLLAAVAAVAALRLAGVALGLARLARMRRRMAPMPERAVRDLALWSRARSEGRSAELRLSPDVSVPTVVGLSRPKIALPAPLVASLSADDLDQIVMHELAHVRRRDDWALVAQRVAEALLFFNPAVWWIGRELETERELACDEWVVGRTGRPRAYAACLLRLAEHALAARGRSLAPGAHGRAPQLALRVESLLGGAGPGGKARRGAAAALAAALAAMLVSAALLPPVDLSAARADGEPAAATAPPAPDPGARTAAGDAAPGLEEEAARAIALDETAGQDPAVRRAALEALGGRAGTVIVMDPIDGRVDAIVNQEWALRRAVAPASTVKLVTALASLEGGAVTVSERVRLPATGERLDLTRAVALSKTEYFDVVGPRAGYERFLETARRLGLGEPTGVNLPGEAAGRLPDASEAEPGVFGIGSGVEVTPMQLAALASALANGGRLLTPWLPSPAAPSAPTRVRRDLEELRPHIEQLAPGLSGAVRYGTASAAYGRERPSLAYAGKTGTSRGDDGSGVGIFLSYEISPRPRYAVVVVLAGPKTLGSDAAAVAARLQRALGR